MKEGLVTIGIFLMFLGCNIALGITTGWLIVCLMLINLIVFLIINKVFSILSDENLKKLIKYEMTNDLIISGFYQLIRWNSQALTSYEDMLINKLKLGDYNSLIEFLNIRSINFTDFDKLPIEVVRDMVNFVISITPNGQRHLVKLENTEFEEVEGIQ